MEDEQIAFDLLDLTQKFKEARVALATPRKLMVDMGYFDVPIDAGTALKRKF